MQHLPTYVYLTFAATVVLTTWLFYKATNYSKPLLMVLLGWMIIQSTLAVSGFYSNPNTMTARFFILIIPPLLFLIYRLITKSGRAFLDALHLPTLTMLHVIRIPVELVLFWLFVNHSIPKAMTFHGSNFDILSGLSAPIIYYFGFIKKTLNKKVILAWNLICLALLLNVVSAAVLSLPARFQQFGFEQPNIALGYFPFVLLPAILVPMVMISTIAAIKQLLKK